MAVAQVPTDTGLVLAGKSREEIIDTMNADLLQEFEQIAAELKEQHHGNLTFYHKLGGRVKKVHSNTAKYGDAAIDKMAFALGIDRSIIYKSMTFYNQFDSKEFKQLLDRETTTGKSITWSHMNQLVHIEEKKVVNELVDMICNKDMTVRELGAELKRRHEGGRVTGRNLTPKSALGGLTQISTMSPRLAEKLAKQFDQVIMKPLTNIEDEQVTDDMVEKVKEASLDLRNLAEAATARADELDKLEGTLIKAADAAHEAAAKAKVKEKEEAAEAKEKEKAAAAKEKEKEKEKAAAAKEKEKEKAAAAKEKEKEKEKAAAAKSKGKPSQNGHASKKRERRPVQA